MTTSTSVAICVVTHDCEADIAPFLTAVARLDPPPDEIVFVDSASSDTTVATARMHAPARLPLAVEAIDSNIGYAAGMNRAVSLTRAPWVLALNADCLPEPDFVARLLARAVSFSGGPVGAVTGRLRRFSQPGEPPLLDACGMFMTWSWRHHDRGSALRDRGQYSRPARVFGATGAAVLLRREALDDVAIDGEAFATEFHSFREDAELAFRLRERGWEVLYEPDARAAHRRTNTPGARRLMPDHVNYHSLKNRYLLRAYHQMPTNLLLTLVPSLFRDALALVYVLVRERSSLAAYSWLWRHRRAILRKRRILRARRTASRSSIERWFWTRSKPA